MTGTIFNYETQKWTRIDTEHDRKLGIYTFETVDGVKYELNPENLEEYRNC